MATRSKLFTKLFLLVWVAGMFQELSWSVLVHFPGFLSDLGASETRIGLLYSLSAVFGLLLRPTLGRLMDNVGRRPVLLAAGLANAVAIAGMTFAESLSWLLVVLFVGHRIFQIAIFTAMLTLSADVLPSDRRTEGLAIFGVGGLFPLATGGAVGDLLLEAGSFDLLFTAAAGIALLSWLLVWMVPRQATPAADDRRRGFFAALGQANLLPLWLLTLLFAAGLEALFTFIKTYVEERQIASVGFFFMVYGFTAIVVRLGTSSRLDRFPHLLSAVGAMGFYAAGLAVLGAASDASDVAVAAVCLGVGHGVLFPVLTSQVVTRAREAERGSAMAIFTSLFDLAVLTAAPLVGLIIDWRGYTTAWVGTSLFIFAGLVVYVLWELRLGTMVDGASRVEREPTPPQPLP